MSASYQNSKHGAVIALVLDYELLNRKQFKISFLNSVDCLTGDHVAVIQRRAVWDTIIDLCRAYLKGDVLAMMDVCHISTSSEATTRKIVKKLEDIGIFLRHTDQGDQRRSIIELAPPYKILVNDYVEHCLHEFKELIQYLDKQ